MGAVQSYVSVSRRPPDVEDYVDMLRRHRSWIIGPTYAGLVIAAVVAFLWPDTYESTAVMRIVPQVVSESIVPATMNLQLSQRLDGLRSGILSRTNLTSLITSKLKLYPNLVTNYTLEDAIAKMTKDVKVEPYGSASVAASAGDRRYQTAFKISFAYPDKYKAKQVVENLVTEFMNENVTVQDQSAKSTQEFVNSKLKEAKDKLDEIKARMLKFEQENAGRLPENTVTNIQMKNSLEMRLSQETDHLNSLQFDLNQLQSDLQTRKEMADILSQSMDETAPAQAYKSQSLAALENQLRIEDGVLAGMRQRLRDTMPEVKDQVAKVNRLTQERDQELKKLEEEQQAPPPDSKKGLSMNQKATLTNYQGSITDLQTRIANTGVAIENATKTKAELEKQIQAVGMRIDASSAVAMQFNQMVEDARLASADYDDLTKRATMSQTAKDLQERHVGEQLEVLDQASLPSGPVDPNQRFVISGVGVALGLMLGLVLAGAREARDTSLKNLKDVRAYTNLPVLSSIPLLENALLVRRKRRLFWLAWSAAIMVGSTAVFIAMTYFYSPHPQ